MFDENIVVGCPSGLCFQFQVLNPNANDRGLAYVPVDMRSFPTKAIGHVVRLASLSAAAEKIRHLQEGLAKKNQMARTWAAESEVPGRGPAFASGALNAAWETTVTHETIKFLDAFQRGALPVRGERSMIFMPGGTLITTQSPDRDLRGPVQALGHN